MRWVCIICEADKRKNREDNIVFKHQYLEVKRCLRYFVAASSAPNEDGLLGAKHKCSEGNPYGSIAQQSRKYRAGVGVAAIM